MSSHPVLCLFPPHRPDHDAAMKNVEESSHQDASGVLAWLKAMPWLKAQRLSAAAPYLTSLLVHAAVLMILAFWVLPILSDGVDVQINAAFSQQSPDRGPVVEVTPMPVTSDGAVANLSTSLPSVSNPPQPVALPGQPADVQIPREVRTVQPGLPSTLRMSDAELAAEIPLMVSALPMHKHRGTTRVEEAESTGTIASQLSGDLRRISEDGDAIVVWMLDQSLSMQQDMKSLAEYLLETLQEISADKQTKMFHYVAAFGDGVRVVQDSTQNGEQVAKAIYNLPPDPSGIENTFQSVEWCIDNLFNAYRWRRGNEKQKLLVIWTDESGDDYLRLENTIQRCLLANVRVEIIGPSAVLGAQTGYTAYHHPADGQTYYLPVHRGPDSSFPQKLSLGYWYRGVPNNYHESFRGPYQGTSPRWQGGSNLTAMLSGFSPYALTRLARETGGRYTMYDRPGDRPPFRLETIRDYMPDYRSLSDIEFDLHRQPLRQLILASSAITWNSPYTSRSEPDTTFWYAYPGQPGHDYRQQTLPLRLKTPLFKALRTAADVEKALSLFASASLTPGWKPNREIPASESPGTAAITADEPTGNNSEGDEGSDASDDSSPADNKAPDTDDDPDPADVDAELARKPERESSVDQSLLEQLYENEPSKRWRAWSDLNLGRLLMVSVRLREYIAVTSKIWQHPDELQPTTNIIRLKPSDQLSGGDVSQQRLAIARMLLERCVENNAGTPWAVMAERELKHPTGLQVLESHVPRPAYTVPVRPVPLQRPALPKL